MFVFVYSSYHLRLSFTHLAVILTTPEIANICLRSQARICGHYHEPSDCFEYPKKSLLKLSYQKNTCQMFLPKKIPESEISNPKISFDHPRHLKSGVPPWGIQYVHGYTCKEGYEKDIPKQINRDITPRMK